MSEKAITALVGAMQKFSTEDGPGIRTTVFLKGCPLDCKWCHNPELIDFKQQIIRLPNSCIKCGYCLEHCPEKACFVNDEGIIDVDRSKCSLCMKCTEFCFAGSLHAVSEEKTPLEVMEIVEQDKGFYDHTGGGMTLSGGEMLSHAEFSRETIKLATERGINSCLDTSGFGDGDVLYELASMPGVKDILYDMKAIIDEVHIEYTGQSNAIILENLKRLASDPEINPKIMMRMPLIKGVNDTEEMISKTAEFYRENSLKKVTLLPYHTLGISKKRNIGEEAISFEAPSEERVEEIGKIFEGIGMAVQILGKTAQGK